MLPSSILTQRCPSDQSNIPYPQLAEEESLNFSKSKKLMGCSPPIDRKTKNLNSHAKLSSQKENIIPSKMREGKMSNFLEKTSRMTKTASDCIGMQLRLEDIQQGELLGKGSYGTVRVVRHTPTGFFMAMKTLKKEKVLQLKITKFIQALKIQFFARHPHVAQIYCLMDTGKDIRVFMELCPDGDLRALKSNFRKPNHMEKVKGIGRGIVMGLMFLHNNHVQHRDIKIENILLSYGEAKITDFDLAVYQPSDRMRTTFCGSPLYFSPEMLVENCYDKRADVWSMGIVLYELLTGIHPFDINEEADIKNMAKHQIKEIPDTVDRDGRDMLINTLDKNPLKRLTLFQIHSHPFFKRVDS